MNKIFTYFAIGVAVLFGVGTYYLFAVVRGLRAYAGETPEMIIVLSLLVAVFGFVFTFAAKKELLRKARRGPRRRQFSPEVKKRILDKQGGRCNSCGEYPRHMEFDHINSRGDNSVSNCQGLCKDCHQDKTNRERRHRDRR